MRRWCLRIWTRRLRIRIKSGNHLWTLDHAVRSADFETTGIRWIPNPKTDPTAIYTSLNQTDLSSPDPGYSEPDAEAVSHSANDSDLPKHQRPRVHPTSEAFDERAAFWR